MSDYAVRLENLTKRFSYYANRTGSLKSALVDLLKGKSLAGEKNEMTALENISFEIKKGEFVGIMGKNGAGKSTLLKLMAGIYEPTSGRVLVDGNVAPMIELGAGFHGDLSGYENIFMNAAILGFGKKATTAAVDSIVEFSDLGKLIDMPIKNYSSGMLVRLGFSIASHLSSEILLVDEVLAVGDIEFQAKCIKKIHQLHREGRTIILVTHAPEQVREHCSRCIVVGGNHIVFDGKPEQGSEEYTRQVQKSAIERCH